MVREPDRREHRSPGGPSLTVQALRNRRRGITVRARGAGGTRDRGVHHRPHADHRTQGHRPRSCCQAALGLAGGKDVSGLGARPVAAMFMAVWAVPSAVPGGTTSTSIVPLPAVVTLSVWRGMVVNQSTRMRWPLSAVSRCGISSQSSRWTDSRCTRTPGRESSAAMRPGNSVSALRECGHQPPSTAPRRLSAGSKLTRAGGGPAGIAEGALTVPPGGMGAARVRLAEPLADGGGRVLVVPWCGAAGSGMRFLLSRIGAARCGAATGRLRPLTGAEQGGCLLRLLTGGGCCGLCQPAGHLPGVTPADRVMVLAVAGHCRRRAVIVKAGEGEFVGGFEVAGGEGGHDVTAPVSGRCPVRPCGRHWPPAVSTGYPTPRAPGAP